MNNKTNNNNASVAADKSAQVERISVSLSNARRAVAYKAQAEALAEAEYWEALP